MLLGRYGFAHVAMILVLCSACGRSRLVSPVPDAGADAPFDAAVDARRVDVGFDAPPIDVGMDAGSSRELIAQLTCGLGAEEMLVAVARYVRCNSDEDLSMVQLMEAWEGFVLGSPDPFPGALSGIPMGCDLWQCYERERVCSDAEFCVADNALDRGCMLGDTRCIGDHVTSCFDDGMLSIVNCARFGATCVDDHCVTPDGCEFGPFRTPGCDGSTIDLCGAELSCPEYNGGACTSFAVMGEVPTIWCSPTGDPGAGAYFRPVECDGDTGVVSFVTETGSDYVFDCRDNGFAGCNARGCR